MAGETVLTIVGNLTADPEIRTTGSGSPVASFTIAAAPRTYSRQSGQWEDGATLFMRCTCWSDMAQHVARSCAKGMRVIAQGRLSQHSWQAQDGSNRTAVELTVDEIGPSLRYATAQVTKQSGSHGGYQGGAVYGNPAGSPSAAPQQTAQEQPASDPWASGGAASPFASADPNGEPDF